MNYADARTALYNATIDYNDALAKYNDVYDFLARQMRGTKAALSEADKRTVQFQMMRDYEELCGDLERDERAKLDAQYLFDIADNAAKNDRREAEMATAVILQNVAQLQYDAAQLNLQAARLTQQEPVL